MNTELKQYDSYYRVEYDYVDQLPTGWQLLPNIAIFEERIERGHIKEELLSVTIRNGVIKQTDVEIKKDSSNEDKSKYKLVKEGDIAINKMRMWQGALGYSEYKGIVSPAYIVLKPKMKINSRFFHYLLRSSFYTNYSKRFSYGIVDDQLSLRYTDFKRMYSIFPPIEIQNAIVAYLDEKNALINNFIHNKKNLINLLEEEKQGLIDKCISQGIRNDELKFDRKELPSYPNHWKLKRTKFLFNILNGYAFSTSSFVSEGVQVIKIGNLYQNKLSLERQPTFVNEKFLKSLKQFVVAKGDILISLTGTLGKKDYGYAIQLKTDDCFLLNQRVAKLIPKSVLNNEYALYILRSNVFLDQLYLLPSGTKQANLSNSDILSIYVAIPDIKEQEVIVAYLTTELSKIDETISKAEQEISAITEYRKSLITNLITGQKAVPM